MEKVTVDDVAQRAGVSPGTVSKALNGRGSSATRTKVAEVAQELGYRPNFFARAMCSSRKNCLGVLASTVTKDDPWVEKILPAIVAAVSECGYRCMADFWEDGGDGPPNLLDSVDGCILLGDYSDDFFPMVERHYRLPLVTVSEKMPYSHGVSLQIDWSGAMHEVVQYLLAHRHTKIGLVVYGTAWPSLEARYKGFLEAMDHFGREIDESMLATADGREVDEEAETGRVEYIIDASRRLTERLLKRRPDVTAIVFGSDLSAFGGITALREAGRRVPEQVSIAAFDNTDWGKVMTPALTSAGVDFRQLSMHMIETLEELAGVRRGRSQEKLRPHLVKRKSVARAPDAE